MFIPCHWRAWFAQFWPVNSIVLSFSNACINLCTLYAFMFYCCNFTSYWLLHCLSDDGDASFGDDFDKIGNSVSYLLISYHVSVQYSTFCLTFIYFYKNYLRFQHILINNDRHA